MGKPLRFEYTDGLADLIGAHKGCEGAIIGTGTSLEGFDFKNLEGLVTIGLNESVKLFTPEYLVLKDTRAVRKSYLNITANTTLVIDDGVLAWMRRYPWPKNPEHLRQTGHPEQPVMPFLAAARRVFVTEFHHGRGRRPDPQRLLFYNCGILTGALSLACVLGLSRVHLYGIDMYRRESQQYAYDISPAAPGVLKEIRGLPGLYITPSMESMARAVERNTAAWQEVEIVNHSRYSQLKCFPIAEDALPHPVG